MMNHRYNYLIVPHVIDEKHGAQQTQFDFDRTIGRKHDFVNIRVV